MIKKLWGLPVQFLCDQRNAILFKVTHLNTYLRAINIRRHFPLKPQAVSADTLPVAVHHLRLWLNLGWPSCFQPCLSYPQGHPRVRNFNISVMIYAFLNICLMSSWRKQMASISVHWSSISSRESPLLTLSPPVEPGPYLWYALEE